LSQRVTWARVGNSEEETGEDPLKREGTSFAEIILVVIIIDSYSLLEILKDFQ